MTGTAPVVTATPGEVVTGPATAAVMGDGIAVDEPGDCGAVGGGGQVHVGGTGAVGGGTDELSAWAAPSATELNPAVANSAATRLLRVCMVLPFNMRGVAAEWTHREVGHQFRRQ